MRRTHSKIQRLILEELNSHFTNLGEGVECARRAVVLDRKVKDGGGTATAPRSPSLSMFTVAIRIYRRRHEHSGTTLIIYCLASTVSASAFWRPSKNIEEYAHLIRTTTFSQKQKYHRKFLANENHTSIHAGNNCDISQCQNCSAFASLPSELFDRRRSRGLMHAEADEATEVHVTVTRRKTREHLGDVVVRDLLSKLSKKSLEVICRDVSIAVVVDQHERLLVGSKFRLG